jgi:hypothetical protein
MGSLGLWRGANIAFPLAQEYHCGLRAVVAEFEHCGGHRSAQPMSYRPRLCLLRMHRSCAGQAQSLGTFRNLSKVSKAPAIDFPLLTPMFRLRLTRTDWPPIRTKFICSNSGAVVSTGL